MTVNLTRRPVRHRGPRTKPSGGPVIQSSTCAVTKGTAGPPQSREENLRKARHHGDRRRAPRLRGDEAAVPSAPRTVGPGCDGLAAELLGRDVA
jgi:hypothetical protein